MKNFLPKFIYLYIIGIPGLLIIALLGFNNIIITYTFAIISITYFLIKSDNE